MKGLRLTLMAGLMVMGFVAFGCDGGNDKDDPKVCDPACETGFTCDDGVCIEDVVVCDPECEDGFTCVEGECIEDVVGCDPECGDGFTCVDGECVEDVVGCDPECGDGFTCVDGECVEDVVECDPACEDGFTCVDGECVEDVVECDPACEDGFTCVDGECVEDVVECDPACEDGFTCVEGECVEDVVECDPACEDGFTCVEGECVEDVVATEFDTLLEYLETDNYLNDAAPKIIGLADVLAEGLETWTIIDVRTADKYGPDDSGVWMMEPNGTPDFDDGHIDGATLVPWDTIATYAKENLTVDDKILVVCHTGHLASHAVMILNLLGYDAYSLKFGMSAWHSDFDLWSGATSSDLTDQFVTDMETKPEAGDFPVIDTGEIEAMDILEARIDEFTAGGPKFITNADLFASIDDYFVINYQPEGEYTGWGHIPGAYQYTPKADLATDTFLATLPTDMPIVVYCYSGQHASQVATWLNIVGYEAYDLKFGNNGMIYDTMDSHKWGGPDTPAEMDYVGMVEKTEFQTLVEYLEGDNGNYLNGAAPKVIALADVLAEGLETWTILDIRTTDKYGLNGDDVWEKAPNGIEDFDDGHIDGAIKVAWNEVVTYAQDNGLTADDKILVVCHTGQLAGHSVMALNLMGFDAYSLKFGMSAWHSDMDLWSGNTGSDLTGQFVTTMTDKPEAGDYPVLDTGETDAQAILEARLEDVYAAGGQFITNADLFASIDDYFVVNYQPEAEYTAWGHIPGAYQYTPKADLATETFLATLPTDMPIVIYCYTGQHASQVVTWLNILGYEAYDLKFGNNGMIYDTMDSHKWGGPATPADMDYVATTM